MTCYNFCLTMHHIFSTLNSSVLSISERSLHYSAVPGHYCRLFMHSGLSNPNLWGWYCRGWGILGCLPIFLVCVLICVLHPCSFLLFLWNYWYSVCSSRLLSAPVTGTLSAVPVSSVLLLLVSLSPFPLANSSSAYSAMQWQLFDAVIYPL